METQQARFILQSYRSGDKDSRDPQFAEALRVAGQDASLNAWLAEELARDDAIRRKLKEFPVPEGLRERILSRQGFATATPDRGRRQWLAIAAALALLGAVATVWWNQDRGPRDFAAYQSQMIELVNGPVRLNFRSPKLTDIQQWLATHDVASGYQLPVGLQTHSDIGCRALKWNGQTVALVCFLGQGKQVIHLFIAPRSALPDAPPTSQPEFDAVDGWTTATWTQGNVVYLMTSRQSREALQKLL